jgi:decaprenylphospho-beta-D-erythro-pentofuranosid-2-ulose 2-reductase
VSRVLIIGATSSIARATARLYAERGDRLYLLARNPIRLKTVAAELGDSVCGSSSADFNDTTRASSLIEAALGSLGGIDLALIAHGELGDQLASESDFDEALRQIETNLLSAIALLIPLANAIEAQGHGALAVMSSVAAERGRPRNYTYASAKAGLNVYLQGVRSRLYPSGGRVHILKLGPTDTPMTVDHQKNFSFSTPEAVARGIVRAIDAGRSEAYIPGYWRTVMAVVRLLPETIFQRLRFLSGRES